MANVRGYTVYGDYKRDNPPAQIIDAVMNKEVDVAVAWGPLAGYFAGKHQGKLSIQLQSVGTDDGDTRFKSPTHPKNWWRKHGDENEMLQALVRENRWQRISLVTTQDTAVAGYRSQYYDRPTWLAGSWRRLGWSLRHGPDPRVRSPHGSPRHIPYAAERQASHAS